MATKEKTFPVTDMSCASCAISVQKLVQSLEGVKQADVNYANQSLKVVYDENETSPEKFKKAVVSIGYDLLIDEMNAKQEQEEIQINNYKKLRSNLIWAAIFTVPLVAIAMFFMDTPYSNFIMLLLSAPVVFLFGRSFFINAYKQAKHGNANMDTLVALSTGIAWLFSVFNTFFPNYWLSKGITPHVYFETAAVVILFVMVGKLLEESAKSNTSSAIKKLIGLQPKTITVLVDGKEISKNIEEAKIGDLVLVKSGEKIAIDGLVTEGSSYVDESMINGEPLATEKTIGSKVYAGTINQKGSFVFKAEKVGADTLLANIIKMVQQAQGSKAPVQKLVDKIAGIFVPVVLILSIVTFFVWIIFANENAVSHGLLAMVTVLVIACPCALGLATPTAIMVGVGKGASKGILIKDAESLEQAKNINAIILDKTGTITEGKPTVDDQTWFNDDPLLKSILKSLESRSEHPLADAIIKDLNSQNIENIYIKNFESLTGKGVKADFNDKTYYVGSHRLMDDLKIDTPREQNDNLNNNTIIYFSTDKELIAIIGIADKIKVNSKTAIKNLHDLGIEVYMLTGDSENTAKAVAENVGIEHYQFDSMPSDKENFVKKLQSERKKVAMVGDGINDSQALARADVSIAMGKGSDIAIDVAKITLISSDLDKITEAIKLSKQTVRIIKQNLFWAFIYNIIGIPLAAGLLFPINGFLLNPMIAGAAMALSSVSVVSNSLRLKFS
ncbi:copper-translocating P-type ATPase [Pedobacter sp. SD-b]|uniref:Copper-translocating P-type ATPase n=1 Tax=Pedobacter segetis TaxID=2793069 RepID=A0ABS1BJ96_9SPHI|nr:heavy metal translocating P-type ATPase [Pedobacter segetis]MBK0382421.1 copper-translocating P-type ATPase [Pedobacter segetis]